MRMPDRLLGETRRTVFWFNATFLAIGFVAVVWSVFSRGQDLLPELLSLAGGALVSAAIVSFVFGAITIRETTAQVENSLARAVEEVLGPLKETLYHDMLRCYRVSTFVDAPPAGDPQPTCLVHLMRVSYEVETLPPRFRVVCLASARDGLLGAYRGEEYILRWLLDESADPLDPRVFSVGYLRVDGVDLPASQPRVFDVPGGQGVEWMHEMPSPLLNVAWHEVEYQVLLREEVGEDTRFSLQNILFRPVSDAEFHYTVGASVGATNLSVSANGLTPFIPGSSPRIGMSYACGYEQLGAHAFARYPIQRGSIIALNVQRRKGALGVGRSTVDPSREDIR